MKGLMNCMKIKFDIWTPLISIFIIHYGNLIVRRLCSGAILGNTFAQQFYINVMLPSPRLETVLFIIELFLLASCIYYFIQLKKQHKTLLSIVYMLILCLMYVLPILDVLTFGAFYGV